MKFKLLFALLVLFSASALQLHSQDVEPPVVVAITPAPGFVTNLTRITVQFSEPVTGVRATNLLVNGVPAVSLSVIGSGNTNYAFTFPRPSTNGGAVHISWSAVNGIMDVAMNAFDGAGAQWDYTVPENGRPVVVAFAPAPGFVTNLTEITVQFSEPVIGVDANDLLINSVPATSVIGFDDTYIFSFPRPSPNGGLVRVGWVLNPLRDAAGNIFDRSLPSAQWNYQISDIAPPVVAEFFPAPGSTVKPLREVRVIFSEAVTNVDARDLLLNGKPARNVSAESASVYLFQFSPANAGKPQLAWASGHNITDLALTPNSFSGAGLIGSYFVDVTPYSILVNATNNVAQVIFSNRFFNGVGTIESREGTRWVPVKNFFATQRVGQVTVKLPTNNYAQLRLRSLEVDAKKGNAFTHLALAYGNISTIAGGAPRPAGTNTWLPEWEGTNATSVYLSDPCCAVADGAGNIYVAERTGHAVDKITPDGRIRTFVGQHRAGFVLSNDFSNLPGTNTLLDRPSALFVVSNKLWVLDAGNDRVRSADLASSVIATEFTDPGLHTNLNAAGLWVGIENADTINQEVFYGAGTELRHREDGLIKVEATGFQEVGSVVVNPLGRTIVADPKDYRVYRVRGTGSKEVVAGSGFPNGPFPRRFLYGGDADEVALPGARTVAYLPIGGYFIGLDQGAQVWYVDSEDAAAPFVFGEPGVHEGDGLWFRQGGRRQMKVGNIVSVTVAPSGDIILVEAGGFVRKIEFLRHRP